MSKVMTAAEAVAMIPDGAVVACSGFLLNCVPREIYHEIAQSFDATGHPANLTVIHSAGNGNRKDEGIVEFSKEGLITRYICGHFTSNVPMMELVDANKVKAYNYPQGVLCHCYRAMAAGVPGYLTKVGLNTFMDPREQGGRVNEVADDTFVTVEHVAGEEYLFYQLPKIDFALIRATSADENGNLTLEDEVAPTDVLDLAMAAKACGGKVIAQVKNYVDSSSIDRQTVAVPGSCIDAIVISQDPINFHRMTPASFYDPVLTGHYRTREIKMPGGAKLDAKKIIARRAAMELTPHAVVNLGIGIPELVANVANEEGIGDQVILTVEVGMIGGIPSGGGNFGSSYNAWCALPESSQFDYYNGGNLALASLGFMEVDQIGNVNASKVGSKVEGVGGFVDISQCTPICVFAGTMTAKGLKTHVEDGKIVIDQEGAAKKFKNTVGQISFSGKTSLEAGQKCLFVTERCVFQITEKGLTLIEVAPGIDIEKDIFDQMEFRPAVADDLKIMDARLFRDEPMGLKEIIGC